MAWDIRGLEDPSSDEFLKDPDLYVPIDLSPPPPVLRSDRVSIPAAR